MSFPSSTYFSASGFSIAIVSMTVVCAWLTGLTTKILMSDSSTQKKLRRSFHKIVATAVTTCSASMGNSNLVLAFSAIVVVLHLLDLRASRSPWIQPRIAPFTISILVASTTAAYWIFSHEPLFFAGVCTYAAVIHIRKIRTRQVEFFQNFHLLQDRLSSFEQKYFNKAEWSVKKPRPIDDKAPKAS